jgi:16S rRNA (uracil1498-N3)-methyltransferase
VLRRLHAPALFVGQVPLDSAQARHARDVLRLKEGDQVELFDDAGTIATGTLRFIGPKDVAATVDKLNHRSESHCPRLMIASAVPKGERADWMIEKLSELGVEGFIPLETERSVVKPEGKNKRERWTRIATESAKQSRRAGVMRVEELRPLAQVIAEKRLTFHLSTSPAAEPIEDALTRWPANEELMLLIGPEGGWTDVEIQLFATAGISAIKLTSTILRIETAAIAAAAIAMVLGERDPESHSARGR